MSSIKTRVALAMIVVAAVVGAVAFGAAQASASPAPIVIQYAKTCNETTGHCEGRAGRGGTIEMQVTSLQVVGGVTQLTLTEWITVRGASFTAEMKGYFDPAGFIALRGTVTRGSFVGAQIQQRSDLVGFDASTNTSSWTGELWLTP
jgi:hypothetical protein